MKVLIFSHDGDIDGMGGVILAKLAFENLTFVLCDTTSLPTEIDKFFKDDSIYDYSLIFVTDLWLENKMLTKIANDKKLNGKFYLFDHHKSAIEDMLDRYPFTKIKVADESGKCCGTSLFYEYLTTNNLLPKVKGLYEFVELVRRYDTWEWKTRFNDLEAYKLNLLWETLGNLNFIKEIAERLKNDNTNFNFTEDEENILKILLANQKANVKEYTSKLLVKSINGYEVGISFAPKKYCNILAEHLRSINYPIDFLIDISLDSGYIYYRSINYNVNVRLLTENIGGKGQDFAASILITQEMYEKIINEFLSHE